MARTKSRSLKKRIQDIVGIDENAPPVIGVKDWASQHRTGVLPAVTTYLRSLFPFIEWVPRYNLTWLLADLVAGITVGMVLVPQSLSYAQLANLPTEYGLYASFIGVLTYAFFATSKDVSIGPVAVMSLETGRVINHVIERVGEDKYSKPVIAVCLAFICGFIVLAIGLLRLGWIVEFIPQPAVSGFMTGSAISIAAGQVPALLGLSSRFDTKAETYHVIIDTLKNLPNCTLDAAFGIPALVLLYLIKWSCEKVSKRYPKYARIAFFASCLRHAFVIIIFTVISWRTNSGYTKPRIKVVGTVPTGLRHVGSPYITGELIGALGPDLPVATIILLLEHISIAKSFGRLNGYKINPNQELIAIGVNNTLGSLFSAYPSTGSFSRSALKSKCGVRTPAAGIATGIVVIIALYAVAPAFYYIPSAALSALIIHAVADLCASPKQSFGFWRVSPIEYIIFVGAVLWSIFYSIEAGIYWSLATSVVLLLIRLARPKGHFLGRVRIQPEDPQYGGVRDVYVSIEGDKGAIMDVHVEPPPPGIIIYRFEESFLYPNASYINDRIVEYVKSNTRRGRDFSQISQGDRPWNDPGPKSKEDEEELERQQRLPLARAVVLDFNAVANIDTTGVQNLIDTRREVEKWADRRVDFHFCGILSPWTRRALIAGGFGQGKRRQGTTLEIAPVVAHANDVSSPNAPGRRGSEGEAGSSTGSSSPSEVTDDKVGNDKKEFTASDVEAGLRPLETEPGRQSQHTLQLLDSRTPFFHFDLAEALIAIDDQH